jgi:hypothetical protein
MAIAEGDVESLSQAKQQAALIWLKFARGEITSADKAALLGELSTQVEKSLGESEVKEFWAELPRIRDAAQAQARQEQAHSRHID